MRCQRVRYYLSAYCRDELSEGERKAIAAHLQSCPACRREEAVAYEMSAASKALPSYVVSTGFNAQLLNRLAEERFKQTRTKAYLPGRIPVISWSRALPVAVVVCLALAFVLSDQLKNFDSQNNAAMADRSTTSTSGLNDDYLTVQPQADHILLQHANVNSGTAWAFDKQLSRSNRIRGLMNSLASQQSFESNLSRPSDTIYLPPSLELYLQIPINIPSNTGTNSTTQAKMVKEVR
jgi:hypothetical protein